MSDPYFDNVTLLLHCDGTDGSTTFTDVKGHTVTADGNAQIDTARSKFGGASALFDGTGDWLTVTDSADWDLPGDFTIEFWVNWNASGESTSLCLGYGGTEGINIYRLAVTNKLGAYINSGVRTTTGSAVLNNGTWYHIAVVRSSGVITWYADGVAQGTYSYAGTFSPSSLTFGRQAAFGYTLNGSLDDIRITKGVARYTTNFTPPTAAYPDTSTDTVTHTITLDASSAVLAAKTAAVDAAAFLSYPASAGSALLGGGAVLQRRYTPTATLSSAIQKQGLIKYTLSGSALQKTQIKTASADSAIGRILTLWAVAGSAELGVQQFLSLAAGYMLAGREYVPSDALVQKTLEKYASANGYVSVVGLTRSLTVDALFSKFKRVYMSSAVQGTAITTSNADSAVQSTLSQTLSAGFYVTGLSSALIVVAQCYLAIAGKLQPGANAVVGKVRTKSPRAGAILGVIFTKTLSVGAALTKAATRTVSANTAVTATRNTTAVPSVTVQSSNMKSLSVGAYLRAESNNTVTDATRFDGEWVVLTRPVEWSADIRGTEFAPHARDTEWVL